MSDPSEGFQRYVEGDSPLHQALPSVKLLLLPVVIALCFSATSIWQVVCVVSFVLLGYQVAGVPFDLLWKSIWRLKYLLLVTILLHLLLTPGRVLWQIPWLSLDGLFIGILVSMKLVLALLFAQLFSYVTTFGELITGARQLSGCLFFVRKRRIESFLFNLGSVCYFLPIVSKESKVRLGAIRSAQAKTEAVWSELQLMFNVLFAEVEKITQQYIDGDNPFGLTGATVEKAMSYSDAILLGSVSVLIMAILVIP